MKQIIRILEYIGTDEWLETTMEKSFVSKEKPFKCDNGRIEEVQRIEKTLPGDYGDHEDETI